MAARVGSRWPVEKSNGPAIAALARWHARTRHVSEKYTLTIAVNDQAVETLTIDPSKEGSRRVRIPDDAVADRQAATNRVPVGRSGHVQLLCGSDWIRRGRQNRQHDEDLDRRSPLRTGTTECLMDAAVPRGFSVVDGSYRSFTNPLTQLPVGDRGRSHFSPRRHQTTGRSGEQYDYLVLTEPIPAGCTVLEGSVSGAFERFEIEPGQITFYIGDRRHPGDIHYTLVGYAPGHFRAAAIDLAQFLRALAVRSVQSQGTGSFGIRIGYG